MKRWLFITGIIIIALLTAVWVYLLFFGDNAKDDLYSLFGFGDTTDPKAIFEPTVTPDTTTQNDVTKEKLRQLSTKPVIGFVEINQNGTSSMPIVNYVEAGTGHIFSLNIETGAENRVSNITVPMAQLAQLSIDGKNAAIKSGEGNNSHITTITINDDGSITSNEVEEASQNFALTDDGELLYTSQNTGTTLGRAYNLSSKSSRTLFAIPFRDVVVDWGTRASDTHTFYPKAASRLDGALYSATKGVVNRMPISGYGLTAVTTAAASIYADQSENSYRTFLYTFSNKARQELPFTFLPEKCVFSKTAPRAICANDTKGVYDISVPDKWYQGDVSYSDDLWTLDLETAKVNLLVETLPISGRELDINNPHLSTDDARVYFQNKNDQTLWLFDGTQPNPQ